MTLELAETLLLLSTEHLFGLDNLNQVADALGISKNRLYRDLKDMSLYQWEALLVGIASTIAIEAIRETEAKSASTQS
jgi:DNA-binding phage protein